METPDPAGAHEEEDRGRVARVADWLFRDRETGRITVAQRPNLSIGIFVGATVVRWVADPAGDVRTALVVVGRLALVWWAVDEIVRGVNPWRRLLGGIVLAGTVGGVVLGR